jgi:hypothetical protein
VHQRGIPYQTKKVPDRALLADGQPLGYGKGLINLKTQEITIEVAGLKERRQLNIVDIGDLDIIVGLDWLQKHNPDVNWATGDIQKRPETLKIAGVRKAGIQSSPKKGRIGRISFHKIMRIYKKTPEEVGVI